MVTFFVLGFKFLTLLVLSSLEFFFFVALEIFGLGFDDVALEFGASAGALIVVLSDI